MWDAWAAHQDGAGLQESSALRERPAHALPADQDVRVLGISADQETERAAPELRDAEHPEPRFPAAADPVRPPPALDEAAAIVVAAGVAPDLAVEEQWDALPVGRREAVYLADAERLAHPALIRDAARLAAGEWGHQEQRLQRPARALDLKAHRAPRRESEAWNAHEQGAGLQRDAEQWGYQG